MIAEFLMWLILFASISVAFCSFLLEALLHDSRAYDLEFLWDGKYTLKDLNFEPVEK